MSIAGIGVTGTDPGDFIQNTTCGATLAPNGTCTIAVLFTPAGAGTRSGKLVVTDNSNNTAGSTQSSTLAGTGAHDVVLTDTWVEVFVVGAGFAAGKTKLRSGGRLADLAPTLLQLMGLPVPPEMTGTSLIARARRGAVG